MITITSAERQEANPPSFAYVRTIVDGLTEASGLSIDEALCYLVTSGVNEQDAFEYAARLRDN